jgi:hypothetical protein
LNAGRAFVGLTNAVAEFTVGAWFAWYRFTELIVAIAYRAITMHIERLFGSEVDTLHMAAPGGRQTIGSWRMIRRIRGAPGRLACGALATS